MGPSKADGSEIRNCLLPVEMRPHDHGLGSGSLILGCDGQDTSPRKLDWEVRRRSLKMSYFPLKSGSVTRLVGILLALGSGPKLAKVGNVPPSVKIRQTASPFRRYDKHTNLR
jgi:hypothetical protein